MASIIIEAALRSEALSMSEAASNQRFNDEALMRLPE